MCLISFQKKSKKPKDHESVDSQVAALIKSHEKPKAAKENEDINNSNSSINTTMNSEDTDEFLGAADISALKVTSKVRSPSKDELLKMLEVERSKNAKLQEIHSVNKKLSSSIMLQSTEGLQSVTTSAFHSESKSSKGMKSLESLMKNDAKKNVKKDAKNEDQSPEEEVSENIINVVPVYMREDQLHGKNCPDDEVNMLFDLVYIQSKIVIIQSFLIRWIYSLYTILVRSVFR